ncbi:MAG TPA: MFS transporter [Steroidobacteraceae bacterium]|jgi:MFS family permease|nr:MFS transporter [Steroidobacteraceae bacterium]
MDIDTSPGADLLRQMDEAKVSGAHWKILFISGMGFFTDAYDLFIIGVVMALIKEEWHPSADLVGLVSSTALLASAIGAVAFGRIADMVGRKRIYGYEVLVLAIGAIASALSPNIWWLIGFRFILGVGIGGDYPVSSTIMSEYSNRRTRGMMVTLVFTMQAAGLIFGPLLASAMLASDLPHPLVWRLLLALGALPALAVFQMRRHLAETPRYLLWAGRHDELSTAAATVLGSASVAPARGSAAGLPPHESFGHGFIRLVSERRMLLRLLGASLAWFMMDFAYYGNTVSTPLVLAALTPKQSLLQHTLTQLAIFAIAALPGYFVAALTMDRLGRKPIQILGFAMMAVSFGAMAAIPGIERLVVPFLIIYGISYFFTEFGPNATTFVYPAEIFRVDTRTTAHGIAAASGKIGAFVGVFLFPILLAWKGLVAAEGTAALASILGLVATVGLLPETKGMSLEELTQQPAAT